MARHTRASPRRNDNRISNSSVSLDQAPYLRREIHKTLPDLSVELREQLARTAVLSRREALRVLDEAVESHDDLPAESVKRAREIIEQYAAA